MINCLCVKLFDEVISVCQLLIMLLLRLASLQLFVRVRCRPAWTTGVTLVRHKPPRGAFCQTSDRWQPDVCCCWTYCLEQSAGGGHFSWDAGNISQTLKNSSVCEVVPSLI